MSVESDQDTWNPLRPDQIRLLRIDSGPEPLIECTLQPHDLGVSKKWYALSYVWGDDSPSIEILVNGKPFFVTPTLFAALTAIWKHFNRDDCTYVWIDAICINQRDNDEKSTQIPLMGQLYSRAEAVLVWFAKEDRVDVRPVLLILECLQGLYDHSLNEASWSGSASAEPYRPTANESGTVNQVSSPFHSKFEEITGILRREHDILPIEAVAFIRLKLAADRKEGAWSPDDIYYKFEHGKQVFHPNHKFWVALLIFVTNPWFERIWTFQEIVLASKAALLHDGGLFSWDVVHTCRKSALRILVGIHQMMLDVTVFRQFGLNPNDLMGQLVKEVIPWGQRRDQFELWTLPRLILETAARKARNPKDYVYGLIGLLDHATASEMVVDYASPTAQVYHSAVRAIIPHGLPAIWGLFEGMPNRMKGLATWCPDFSLSPMNDSFWTSTANEKLDQGVLKQYATSYSFSLSEDLLRLRCRVLLLDRVTHSLTTSVGWSRVMRSGDPWNNRDELFPILFRKENRLWIQEMRLLLLSSDISNLISEVKFELIPKRPRDFNTIFAYCSDLDYYDIQTLHEARKIIEMPAGFEDKVFEDMFHFTFTLNGAYAFKTVLGRIGMSYRPVDRGDVIVLVPGGQSLFVLSKDLDQYKGTAYVRGLMGSSLLEIPDDMPHQWVTVDLY